MYMFRVTCTKSHGASTLENTTLTVHKWTHPPLLMGKTRNHEALIWEPMPIVITSRLKTAKKDDKTSTRYELSIAVVQTPPAVS